MTSSPSHHAAFPWSHFAAPGPTAPTLTAPTPTAPQPTVAPSRATPTPQTRCHAASKTPATTTHSERVTASRPPATTRMRTASAPTSCLCPALTTTCAAVPSTRRLGGFSRDSGPSCGVWRIWWLSTRRGTKCSGLRLRGWKS